MKKLVTIFSVMVVGALAVVYLQRANRFPEIEVTSTVSGLILHVRNIGSRPIKITNLLLNDREDCSLADYHYDGRLTTAQKRQMFVFGFDRRGEPNSERTIQTGETAEFRLSCQGSIVRVGIWTDQGSATYTFNHGR